MTSIRALWTALISVGVFAASSAWATSPFLPISAANTFRSSDRARVEAAIEQATASQKSVLIDMAGAWCGVCAQLDQQMEQKKAEMAPILSHFVYVQIEEMHLEMLSGADFLPTEIVWLPSIYVYNPATQKWSFLYAEDADSLKATLTDYLAHPSLSSFYVSELQGELHSKAKISTDDIFKALLPLSVEASGQDLLAATGAVVKALRENPGQFDSSLEDLELNLSDIYLRAVDMGKLTLEQIRQADPNSFAELGTDPRITVGAYFKSKIGYLIRTQGNLAASNQCAAISASAKSAEAKLPETYQHLFAIQQDLQCLMLQVQLKQKTGDDVATYAASLNSKDQRQAAEFLMKDFALTGTNFQQAINYGKMWKSDWEKRVASSKVLLPRVQKATQERLNAYAAGKTHP